MHLKSQEIGRNPNTRYSDSVGKSPENEWSSRWKPVGVIQCPMRNLKETFVFPLCQILCQAQQKRVEIWKSRRPKKVWVNLEFESRVYLKSGRNERGSLAPYLEIAEESDLQKVLPSNTRK